MEWIYQYGLFLAKIATIVVAIIIIAVFALGLGQRKSGRKGELQLTDLSEQYREIKKSMQEARMDESSLKQQHKQEKKQEKEEAKLRKRQAKAGEISVHKPCTYVIDFKGSMDAHEVTALREEVTAVLAVATVDDEVLLRLESPGGVVHGYGLAASQLDRIRQKGIPLTASVDKVAASGGYMMACVAERIVAAPFAIIGSIGVVAQIPNFNKLLKKNDIDLELHTAGEFKRTLTLFGENTEQGREKFQQELEETHILFKNFVQQHRPGLDIDKIATGEHWFGSQAKTLGLVDEISTSDDLLVSKIEHRDVIAVKYAQRKPLINKVMKSAAEGADSLLLRWWQRGQKPLL